jgi:DNA-binding IclR family transcriptional regulator
VSARSRKAKYDAPAVRQAIRVIEFLADRGRPAGVTEIARGIGTNKNMAYRLLATLAGEDWVRQAPTGGGYQLTLQPFRSAGRVVNRLDLVGAAEGPMRTLMEALEEYVYLGVLHKDRVMFVRDLRPPHKPVQIGGNVGLDYPLHDNAPGKVLLAWGGEALFDRVARRGLPRTTPRTLTDPRILRRHLAEVRRQGYATDLEENVKGVLCYAVPVFGREGAIAGTVGTTVLSAFHTVDQLIRKLGPAVGAAGRRISAALGADGRTPRAGEDAVAKPSRPGRRRAAIRRRPPRHSI